MPFSTLASHNPIDYLSFSSFYVETYFNEHILSKATAFVTKNRINIIWFQIGML